MVTVQEKRRAFRDMLRGSVCEMAPSAYDGLSAMLIQRAGFKAAHMTGNAVHRSYGFPDAGVLTLTEQVARATVLADVVDIPIIGDAETGHGGVVNVVRAVREFERSGVAAIHIEDQVTPKRTGEGLQAQFIPLDEFVGKIKAAVDARTDQSFGIIARSDSRPTTSFEAVVERAVACAEAGADAIWLSLRDAEERRKVTRLVPKPMVGIFPRPLAEATEMGFKISMVAGVLAMAASWAMSSTLAALKEKGAEDDFFASLPGFDEVRTWYNRIGFDMMQELDKRYGTPVTA